MVHASAILVEPAWIMTDSSDKSRTSPFGERAFKEPL